MQNMSTLVAGYSFQRIPQIDPDQLHTMEDITAALRTIHDELNVKDRSIKPTQIYSYVDIDVNFLLH